MSVTVQTQDFDVGKEVALLHSNNARVGAIVSFVGLVRDVNEGLEVREMNLEHYPAMTEKSLKLIEEQCEKKWRLLGIRIIHRYGKLKPTDQIVLVIVASEHRGDAFKACEFLMDYLKTQAPFGRKKQLTEGSWVDARSADDDAAKRWTTSYPYNL